jgi:hypothetical protein
MRSADSGLLAEKLASLRAGPEAGLVSYLHCPTCACAYNVAREPVCPRCGVRPGTPADPTDDIISAVEQLARAMARATPIELVTAQAILDRRDAQLALPAPGKPTAPSPQLLRAVRAALEPTPAQPSRLDALFAQLSPERRARWRAAIDAALARLAPRLPAKTGARARLPQAMFLFAKSQFTRLQNASTNFARALR